jgi:hypothetical protein
MADRVPESAGTGFAPRGRQWLSFPDTIQRKRYYFVNPILRNNLRKIVSLDPHTPLAHSWETIQKTIRKQTIKTLHS